MNSGSTKPYDVIVVGGGLEGLICAAYLAKANRRVLLLEQRQHLGGTAVSQSVFPGFTFSTCSQVVNSLSPRIIRDLKLVEHGYQAIPVMSSFSPFRDSRSLCRWTDIDETRREIARFSSRDAENYGAFRAMMTRWASAYKSIPNSQLSDAGPLHLNKLFNELDALKHCGVHSNEHGNRDSDLASMSAASFLGRYFESDQVKASLACSAMLGSIQSVNAPGTAATMMNHHGGGLDGFARSRVIARGGLGALSNAVTLAATSHGVEIRTSTEVRKVIVQNGQCVGVVLTGGDELRASAVASGLSSQRTLLGLVGSEHLPDELTQAIDGQPSRGILAKVNLALDRVPEFACRPGVPKHLRGEICIAPSIDDLARAFQESETGAYSERPAIHAVIPTLVDSSLAPAGKHIMSCFAMYAPYDLDPSRAQWPDRRAEFGDNVIQTLEEYIPDLREIILHQQVLTPVDLKREFGSGSGDILYAERFPESFDNHRFGIGFRASGTPIANLWMCGAGPGPGSEFVGAPGASAARTLLNSGLI